MPLHNGVTESMSGMQEILQDANENNPVTCTMTNKNPETDIGVPPEDQKSKAANPLKSSYL